MKVLFDTNVILDTLLNRQPFAITAQRLVARVERGEIVGLLGATTVTTIHYLLTKAADVDRARDGIRDLLQLFTIAPVNADVLNRALSSSFRDYEDGVLYEAAVLSGADVIVTRDRTGFSGARLRIETPVELEARLSLAADP